MRRFVVGLSPANGVFLKSGASGAEGRRQDAPSGCGDQPFRFIARGLRMMGLPGKAARLFLALLLLPNLVAAAPLPLAVVNETCSCVLATPQPDTKFLLIVASLGASP